MIRRMAQQDFEFIYELYMHPEVNKYLLYEPMPETEFTAIFADLLQKQVIYIFEHTGSAAGMFKLVPYTYRASHVAYLGGLAIHPSRSGKGLGSLMMKEILDHAKKTGVLRVELSAAVINEKAIRLYEKAGFQKEGILRKYTRLKKENQFLDEVMMAWVNE
jgi:RimJ/RimL family protein N-acetyltransferase